MNSLEKTIVCPGCAWTGEVEQLNKGACPECGYENGIEPFRLLTLSELMLDDSEYNNVLMGKFLRAVLRIILT